MSTRKLMQFWNSPRTWRRSAQNTAACVLGCSIGEFSTLLGFQYMGINPIGSYTLLALPIVNGIMSSLLLETTILSRRGLPIGEAVRTAFGMSMISMTAMEIAMEATDYCLTGGMTLQLWVIPPMLLAGFVAPLPYNYWRIRKHNKSCH